MVNNPLSTHARNEILTQIRRLEHDNSASTIVHNGVKRDLRLEGNNAAIQRKRNNGLVGSPGETIEVHSSDDSVVSVDKTEHRLSIVNRLKKKCGHDLRTGTPTTKGKAKKCFATYYEMQKNQDKFDEQIEFVRVVQDDGTAKENNRFDSLGVHETMMEFIYFYL